MKDKLIIGTRESLLAVTQAKMVQEYINKKGNSCKAELLTMKTTGDIILDKPLEKVGGKGLFVKELDRALMSKASDLSVHSLKDVPMELPKELPLLGYSKREDPRDALVLPSGACEIDFSKPIGCSSKRRMIQLKLIYPEATFATIRGNVQTRLRKLDSGEFSATILAAAGLKRLGLEERINRYFEPDEMVSAAGQGILAVQGRAGEDYSILDGYFDIEAAACAIAERTMVKALGGDCSTPIAAFATVQDGEMTLRGFYMDETTGKIYKGKKTGVATEPELLGEELAKSFLQV